MSPRLTILAVAGFAALVAARPVAAATILVEAESLAEPGGWVVDQQFMDRMGSPFLLAHGLGRPVADAMATVPVTTAGVYRVWVRTRDWVGPWKGAETPAAMRATGSPGQFQVLVNGQPLPTAFGVEGAAWHWQDGGSATLAPPAIALALHDLTGFEGRCDAVLLTTDPALVPPDADPALAAFRRRLLGLPDEPADGGAYDLVVTGGGIAGVCASLSAARLGLRTALIQDRPVVGGNNSSEVRVWLQGARNKAPWPRVGDIVAELECARHAHYGPANTAEIYEDGRRLALCRAETNLTLFLSHRVNGVVCADGRLRAAVAQDVASGRRVRIAGRWFADCTGDGDLGFLAGADHELTPAGHMGLCNLWHVEATGAPVSFPRCPWALDLAGKPFPGRGTPPDPLKLGGWYWESGFDRDPIGELEAVRDWNFRAMYGAWDALKNVDRVLPAHRLAWCAHIMGRRESRRLLGDVVLTLRDLADGVAYPDGCVPTGWKVDLHLPDPKYVKGFEGDAFISHALFTDYRMPYWIPYRCLYSRNVPNLFMAGRDISVTHEALGAVRVMRTGGCMGEIVGLAAYLCRKHETDPRGVYAQRLPELQELMRVGVGKPAPAALAVPPAALRGAGTNIAGRAALAVSGSLDGDRQPPALLTDGRLDLRDNALRWLSRAAGTNWIELTWERPRTVAALRVVSGYNGAGGDVTEPIADFVFQRHDGAGWVDVAGARVTGNARVDWSAACAPFQAARLRLLITRTRGGIARIWELEVYGP